MNIVCQGAAIVLLISPNRGEQILVTKSDLDEKTAQMSDLTNKVEEMRTHHGYQVCVCVCVCV